MTAVDLTDGERRLVLLSLGAAHMGNPDDVARVAAKVADDLEGGIATFQFARHTPLTPAYEEFTNAAALEAHLLDAHRQGFSSLLPREDRALANLRRWHAEAHAAGRFRFQHEHALADLSAVDPSVCPVNDGKHGPFRVVQHAEVADTHVMVRCEACGTTVGYPISRFADDLDWGS